MSLTGQPAGQGQPARTRPSRRGGGPPGRPTPRAGAGRLPVLPAGTRIAGRYRLLDRIGGPDWSPLWRGTDELLIRPVAVWLLPPGPVPEGVAGALRRVGRMTDPRITRIFDADYLTEHPYVVSEWARGEALESLLSQGELPDPALATRIAAEAASALAGAHAAGQPHLYLTPRSVRWDGDSVTITGLGMKAALRGEPPGAGSGHAAQADARALAGVLYALLTGYWPGEEPCRLPPAPRHRGRLYSPQQVRAGVPSALSAITARVLLGRPVTGPPILNPAAFARALRDMLPPGLPGSPAPGRVMSAARMAWRCHQASAA